MKCGRKIWSTLVDYFLIIGAVVGVGFASGKDIYVFFYQFGGNSLFGLAGFVLIYIYLFLIVQYISNKLNLKEYDQFNTAIFGSFCKITNIVLFVNFTITSAGMLAGANYLFSTFLNFPIFVPSLILSLVIFVLLCSGEGKVKAVANFIVPVIITVIILNGFSNITPENVHLDINIKSSSMAVFYALLFAVNNFVPALPTLIETKLKTRGKLSSIALIVVIILINILLLGSNTFSSEMPLLEISNKLSIGFYYIYFFAIIFALFCTLTICSLNSYKMLGKNKKSVFVAGFIVITNLIISNLGYDFIVRYLYVLSGIISALYVLCMIAFIVVRLMFDQRTRNKQKKQKIETIKQEILKN